jgi:hypothetical protein
MIEIMSDHHNQFKNDGQVKINVKGLYNHHNKLINNVLHTFLFMNLLTLSGLLLDIFEKMSKSSKRKITIHLHDWLFSVGLTKIPDPFCVFLLISNVFVILIRTLIKKSLEVAIVSNHCCFHVGKLNAFGCYFVNLIVFLLIQYS